MSKERERERERCYNVKEFKYQDNIKNYQLKSS